MVEIRKSSNTENAEKEDVESLKRDIKNLKSRMTNMSREMEKMASLVSTVMQRTDDSSPAKRRKTSSSPLPFSVPSRMPQKFGGELESFDDISVDLDMFGSATLPGIRKSSGSSLASMDDQLLGSLFALDSRDDINVVQSGTTNNKNFKFPEKNTTGAPPAAGPNTVLMAKLRNALSVLPENLQEMFVDRVVTFVVDPDSFRQQVDAVSSLAMAAAAEARNRMGDTGENSKQTNALASSILGAWISHYGSSSAPVNSNAAPSIQVPVSSVAVNDPLKPAFGEASGVPHQSRESHPQNNRSGNSAFMPPLTAL